MFFSFFYFKPFVTSLFIQLLWNLQQHIPKLEEQGSGSSENRTTVLF